MTSRIVTRLARRRFLMGTGSACVALPFLLGREGASRVAAAGAPERVVSVYFGNGLPADLTKNGLTGVLAPLAPFADQLTTLRGITAAASAPGTGHIAGSASFCCGMDSGGNDKDGPSLDWVCYENLGAKTPLPVLAAGAFGKTKPERLRWIHSWRAAGQPNNPYADTAKVFNLLFGSADMPSTDAGAGEARYRYKISVLDAVLEEYKQVSGPSSPYPPSVPTRPETSPAPGWSGT